jgi:hypothetical protein
MRLLAPVLLLFASCGNYGNVYLPSGERKPISGPNPKQFPAALETPLEVETKAKIRLNIAPGGPAELKASWSAPAQADIVWRVNARKVGDLSCSGECTIARPVPDGTILPGVATLIELETTAPVTVTRLVIER